MVKCVSARHATICGLSGCCGRLFTLAAGSAFNTIRHQRRRPTGSNRSAKPPSGCRCFCSPKILFPRLGPITLPIFPLAAYQLICSHHHHYRFHHHHNHHHHPSPPPPPSLASTQIHLPLHPPSQSPFQPPAPRQPIAPANACRPPCPRSRPRPIGLAAQRHCSPYFSFFFFPSRTRSVALSGVERVANLGAGARVGREPRENYRRYRVCGSCSSRLFLSRRLAR